MPDQSNELSPEEAKLVLKAIEEAECQEADEQQQKTASSSDDLQADQ